MNKLTKLLRKLSGSTPGNVYTPSNITIDFQSAANSVIDYGIVAYDLNGIIISWNKGAESMSGFKEEEIIGKSFEIFYSEEDIENGIHWHNLKMTETLGRFETNGWRKRKDGSLGWGNILFNALRNNTGGLYGYLIIIRDITEAKKTQEQLELFSKQINQSNDSIYTVDANYRITSWNKGSEKLYGYTKEEALNKIPNELLKTAIKENDLSAALNIIDDTGYWSGELMRTTKSGKNIYVHSSTSNIRDAAGKVTGFIGVSYNITAQKQLETRVKHLANIVEQSTDAISSTTLDGRIITWNKGAEKIYGYSKKDAINETAASLGLSSVTSADIALFFKEVLEKKSMRAEMEFTRKDGSTFFGSYSASVVINDKGIADSVVFITKDVSINKQLEEELKRSNEELELKVKERTEEIYKREKKFRAMVE